MSEITTQSLIENINSQTIQSIQLKGKIAEKKQALAEYPENKEIEELQSELNKVVRVDTELRSNVKETMLQAGMKKFEALDGTIVQLNKKPGKLIVENENFIGLDEYWKEKTTRSFDKATLKKDIKEGLIIDGVYMEEDFTLVIKN